MLISDLELLSLLSEDKEEKLRPSFVSSLVDDPTDSTMPILLGDSSSSLSLLSELLRGG